MQDEMMLWGASDTQEVLNKLPFSSPSPGRDRAKGCSADACHSSKAAVAKSVWPARSSGPTTLSPLWKSPKEVAFSNRLLFTPRVGPETAVLKHQ